MNAGRTTYAVPRRAHGHHHGAAALSHPQCAQYRPLRLGQHLVLRKAGRLILFISVLIWALSYFPGAGLEDSYLARFGHSLAPVGDALGLDWRLLVALLASFVAKENAIAALGILYGSAQGASLAETLAATVPPASALSFIAATMLFIPCATTIAVMRQETGSWGWTLFGVALLLVIALGAAALVYQVCRLLGFGLG